MYFPPRMLRMIQRLVQANKAHAKVTLPSPIFPTLAHADGMCTQHIRDDIEESHWCAHGIDILFFGVVLGNEAHFVGSPCGENPTGICSIAMQLWCTDPSITFGERRYETSSILPSNENHGICVFSRKGIR